jgi:hypothetical protein
MTREIILLIGFMLLIYSKSHVYPIINSNIKMRKEHDYTCICLALSVQGFVVVTFYANALF